MSRARETAFALSCPRANGTRNGVSLSPLRGANRLPPPAKGVRMTVEELKAARSTLKAEKELIVDAVDQLGEEAAQV